MIHAASRSSQTPSLAAVFAIVVAVAAIALPILAPSAVAEVMYDTIDASENPPNRLNISPGRVELAAVPGVRQTFEVELTNEDDVAVDISVAPTDVGAASDPRSVADRTEDGEFGAGDWLTSEIRDIRLEPFQKVTFDVVIDPPTDAPVGTNLAGLIIDGTEAEGTVGTGDATGAFRIQGLIQVFLTAPGPVKHDVRMTDIDVRDSFVVGSHRVAVWEIALENRGTVNEHVSGTVDVKSLFGNTAVKLPVKDTIILRGGKRIYRLVWNDLPWVGRFTPEARLRGDDAKLLTGSGEPVTALPWWLPVSILLAVAVPALWLWWRRRREWQLYLDEDDAGEVDPGSADETWDEQAHWSEPCDPVR